MIDISGFNESMLEEKPDYVFLKQDGTYAFVIEKAFVREKRSEGGNQVGEFWLKCIDDDAAGATTRHYPPISGKDKNNVMLVKNLFQIARSAGRNDLVKTAIAEQKCDTNEFLKALEGLTIYARVALESAPDKKYPQARIKSTITEEDYLKARTEGGDHWRRDPQLKTATKPVVARSNGVVAPKAAPSSKMSIPDGV